MTKTIIIFLFLLSFLVFFFQKTRAEQTLNCVFPPRCQENGCFLGLPDNTECVSRVSVNLSQIEKFLGYRTRLPVELNSLNQFCKQYTRDESAWALSINIYNYCDGHDQYCDQSLDYWTNSGWSKKQACDGTLSVREITCAKRCTPSFYVDLKANNSDGPIEILAKSNLLLSWEAKNVFFCEASGDWTGFKNLLGSETVFLDQAKQYLFSLKCKVSPNKKDPNKEIQDIVKVNVKAKEPVVVTKPVVNTY